MGLGRDIYDEWIFQTDPVNLQPKVRPLLRRAAELIRKYPPAGMDQPKVDEIANALEAPWGLKIENLIREQMGETLNSAAAGRIAAEVKRLGLKPYLAPEPLPPIELGEVELVCWMALSV